MRLSRFALVAGALWLAACGKRVHVDATLLVFVHTPAGAPAPGELVSFHAAKWSGGAEEDSSPFDVQKQADSTGHASLTVGFNLTTDEDVALEAWTGDGTNRDRELITGGEVHAMASGTDLAVISRGLDLLACPTEAPSLCGGACTDRRYDSRNCGTCGHPCQVDCLDGACIPCSNVAGAWAITGDCPVTTCTVSQDTCAGTLICTHPDGTPTDAAPVTAANGTATFGTTLGTCNVTVSGDQFSGTCGNDLVGCTVAGTRTAH